MTPSDLAAIHKVAFTQSRAWGADEFSTLLAHPNTALFYCDHGFALVQSIAGEAELLTIAVTPKAQGKGLGRALMFDWMQGIDATEAFLEVASDNLTALSLYRSCGFVEVGQRKAYYARKDAAAVDAIVMRCLLT